MKSVLRTFSIAFALTIGVASAQSYPSGPVTINVPFGAGTSTDLTGRIIAEQLSKELGQPVVVENRAGAGGSIGTAQVVAAKPDGHTLSLGTVGTLAINKALYSNLPYDPAEDLMPIAFIGYVPTLLVVKGDSPFNSVQELVEYARDNPDQIAFASAGSGTSGHLGGEFLRVLSGTQMIHVPYKEGAQAMTAVMAGEVDFLFYHPTAVMPHVKDGALKALAASSSRRSTSAPDVPTMIESGYPEFDLMAWWALVAPAGLPDAVKAKLTVAAERVVDTKAVQEKFAARGIEKGDVKGAQLEVFIRHEIEKWARIAEAAKARVD